MSHWLTWERKTWCLLMTGIICLGWQSLSLFILFQLKSEAKHPVGGTIVYFCSFPNNSISSRGPITAPVSPAHPSFVWLQCNIAEIPSGKHQGLSYFKDSQQSLGPGLRQLRDQLEASVDTKNQKEEGRRRSWNGRSWTSEEWQRQVHRWVPVRVLPGQKRRWERVICQDIPPPWQPASHHSLLSPSDSLPQG